MATRSVRGVGVQAELLLDGVATRPFVAVLIRVCGDRVGVPRADGALGCGLPAAEFLPVSQPIPARVLGVSEGNGAPAKSYWSPSYVKFICRTTLYVVSMLSPVRFSA